MEKLENLRLKYREIFNQTAEEISNFIANTQSGKEILEYFDNHLTPNIKAQIENINQERKKIGCGGCGTCCRFAVSEFSPVQLKQNANNGDNFAAQFIKTFIPYNSIEDAKKIYPEYVEYLKANTDGEFYIYHCPKVTDCNRCSVYHNRPQICRDFPESFNIFLPKTCSFNNWRLKNLPVLFKLRAQSEIIGFYKQKLKEIKNT